MMKEFDHRPLCLLCKQQFEFIGDMNANVPAWCEGCDTENTDKASLRRVTIADRIESLRNIFYQLNGFANRCKGGQRKYLENQVRGGFQNLGDIEKVLQSDFEDYFPPSLIEQ